MYLLPAHQGTGPYKVLHGSTSLITPGYLWLLDIHWREGWELHGRLEHIINSTTTQELQEAQQIPCSYF